MKADDKSFELWFSFVISSDLGYNVLDIDIADIGGLANLKEYIYSS
jgi:hypothetical protein